MAHALNGRSRLGKIVAERNDGMIEMPTRRAHSKMGGHNISLTLERRPL